MLYHCIACTILYMYIKTKIAKRTYLDSMSSDGMDFSMIRALIRSKKILGISEKEITSWNVTSLRSETGGHLSLMSEKFWISDSIATISDVMEAENRCQMGVLVSIIKDMYDAHFHSCRFNAL